MDITNNSYCVLTLAIASKSMRVHRRVSFNFIASSDLVVFGYSKYLNRLEISTDLQLVLHGLILDLLTSISTIPEKLASNRIIHTQLHNIFCLLQSYDTYLEALCDQVDIMFDLDLDNMNACAFFDVIDGLCFFVANTHKEIDMYNHCIETATAHT